MTKYEKFCQYLDVFFYIFCASYFVLIFLGYAISFFNVNNEFLPVIKIEYMVYTLFLVFAFISSRYKGIFAGIIWIGMMIYIQHIWYSIPELSFLDRLSICIEDNIDCNEFVEKGIIKREDNGYVYIPEEQR